jgi:hypothetical protein
VSCWRWGLRPPPSPTRNSSILVSLILAAGGDIAVSPDNIAVSDDYIMICEDGTAPSRAVMAAKGRQGNIWRLDLRNNYRAELVAELAPSGIDGVRVGPGIWETSGIIDMSSLMGPDIWLFDVQAHPPTTAPGRNTVEDGQLLLMIRKPITSSTTPRRAGNRPAFLFHP